MAEEGEEGEEEVIETGEGRGRFKSRKSDYFHNFLCQES